MRCVVIYLLMQYAKLLPLALIHMLGNENSKKILAHKEVSFLLL